MVPSGRSLVLHLNTSRNTIGPGLPRRAKKTNAHTHTHTQSTHNDRERERARDRGRARKTEREREHTLCHSMKTMHSKRRMRGVSDKSHNA